MLYEVHAASQDPEALRASKVIWAYRDRRDFKESVEQQDPQGPKGDKGATGATGPIDTEAMASITIVDGSPVSLKAGETASAQVNCPAGDRVIAGGGNAEPLALLKTEASSSHEGWTIVAKNTTAGPLNIKAEATCAPTGKAITIGGSS